MHIMNFQYIFLQGINIISTEKQINKLLKSGVYKVGYSALSGRARPRVVGVLDHKVHLPRAMYISYITASTARCPYWQMEA